jgi:Ca-activated chloride channel family protein
VSLHFESPYFLLLLVLLPPLAWWQLRRRPMSGAFTLASLRLVSDLRPTWRVRYRWLVPALRLLALALLVLALARPQVGQAGSTVPAEGIDIVLALDVSGSMTEAALGDSTRLDVAKDVLGGFIAGRENDRLGLVTFRSQSLALSPLTLDYEALRELVDRADASPMPDGTAIGLAVADSLNLLRESRARSRVVILLTDGENNRFEVEPLAAARIAGTLKIRVYTIGVVDTPPGGAGEERPSESSMPRPDLNVNEQALRRMAEVSGGRYYRADSPDTLAGIYDEIGDLEKSRVGRERFSAFDERSASFLVPALALLGLEVLLASTVFRKVP